MAKENFIQATSLFKNQDGSAIIFALMTLVILTILGISSITTTTTEQKIARNDMYYKLSFYAAEAAKEFVPPNTQLYHADNVTVGNEIQFPIADGLDNDDDTNIDEADETMVVLNTTQSFDGSVGYDGSSLPPRGSGYDVGSYKSHRYIVTGNGYGPFNTQRSIEAGFYRIGF